MGMGQRLRRFEAAELAACGNRLEVVLGLRETPGERTGVGGQAAHTLWSRGLNRQKKHAANEHQLGIQQDKFCFCREMQIVALTGRCGVFAHDAPDGDGSLVNPNESDEFAFPTEELLQLTGPGVGNEFPIVGTENSGNKFGRTQIETGLFFEEGRIRPRRYFTGNGGTARGHEKQQEKKDGAEEQGCRNANHEPAAFATQARASCRRPPTYPRSSRSR